MAEAGEIEKLYFYCKNGGSAIGVARCQEGASDLTSIVGRDRFQRFFHLLFTPKETRMMITALQEVLAETDSPPSPT